MQNTCLFEPVGDASAIQIVDGKFNGHLVSRQYLDIVHPHLARNMSQYLVAVLEFNPKHGVRKGLENRTFKLDYIFFGQQCSFKQLVIKQQPQMIPKNEPIKGRNFWAQETNKPSVRNCLHVRRAVWAAQSALEKRNRQVFARCAAALSALTAMLSLPVRNATVDDEIILRVLPMRSSWDSDNGQDISPQKPRGFHRASLTETDALQMKWLGHQDSNLDSWYQKPESCRWTMAQC